MEKEQFNKVLTNYQKLAEDCQEFVDLFEEGFSLDLLTIQSFKNLIKKARDLQGRTDHVLHNELYHLIGMGELSPTQLSKICSIIKKISHSRSYFKPVAGYVLNNLPEVPDKSSYKCEVADIKLVSKFEK